MIDTNETEKREELTEYRFYPEGEAVTFQAANNAEAQTIAAARFHGIPGELYRFDPDPA